MEAKVIIGLIPGTRAWQQAMSSCNKADKEFTPLIKKQLARQALKKLMAGGLTNPN